MGETDKTLQPKTGSKSETNRGTLPRIAQVNLTTLHRQKLTAEFCHEFDLRLPL